MHRSDSARRTQYDERGQRMTFVPDRIVRQQQPSATGPSPSPKRLGTLNVEVACHSAAVHQQKTRQVGDALHAEKEYFLSLPSHVESTPAESAGVLKWVKGKGKKLQRKVNRLNWRNLTKGVGASGQTPADQEEQRQAVDRKEATAQQLFVCRAELGEYKKGRAGSNTVSLHASSFGLSPRSPYAPSQGFSGARTSTTRILAAWQHKDVPSPEKPYVLIELRCPEEVKAVVAAVLEKRVLTSSIKIVTRGAVKSIFPDETRYILCTLAWEKLKGRSWWRFLAENGRNRSGFRWLLFSLDRDAQKPDERLKVDLHMPSKFRDGVPSQTLPSAAAADAVEEWLAIIQQHFIKEVCKSGVKVITGRGLDTGGMTYKATEKRLATLFQRQRLVSSFQGDGGALTVWLLEPTTSRW